MARLRKDCLVSRNGANAMDIVQAARVQGLHAGGRRLERLEELAALPAPAVLHWDFNHFVVLERVRGNEAVIVDPRIGRFPVRLENIGRHFTGIALVFSPAPGFARGSPSQPSLAHYATLLRGYVPNLAHVLLASLAAQALALLFPMATRILVDRVIVPSQAHWLWGLGIGMGMVVLASLVMTLVRGWVVQSLHNALDMSLMRRFLEHLLRLPLQFFAQREPGDLVQRVQSNAMLRGIFTDQSVGALLDAFLIAGYALLMLAFDWKLALVVLGFGSLRVLQLAILHRRNHRLMASELTAMGREENALISAMTGLESTKAFAAESRMVGQWQLAITAATNHRFQRRMLQLNATQLMVLLKGGAMAIVLWLGGMSVLEGDMSLGVFVAFLMLVGLFMAPLESLASAALEIQLLGTHLRRMDDVLGEDREPSGSRPADAISGEITLENVEFRYAGQTVPTLHAINLDIRRGEKVAIVGHSGAGKSTLAALMLAMHAPSGGSIRFDGVDLGDYDLSRLRRRMGVVLQEPFLFDDSVRSNIALHDPAMPIERVRRAAAIACIDDVVEALPQGYATRVGENGSLLSGGQRQRLALARAIAHGPAILLLDEATSALDPSTEARLHANLADLSCTRIVIAHRLSTVMDADRIVVLEAGRIVQQGKYGDLLREGGAFSRMARAFNGEEPGV